MGEHWELSKVELSADAKVVKKDVDISVERLADLLVLAVAASTAGVKDSESAALSANVSAFWKAVLKAKQKDSLRAALLDSVLAVLWVYSSVEQRDSAQGVSTVVEKVL